MMFFLFVLLYSFRFFENSSGAYFSIGVGSARSQAQHIMKALELCTRCNGFLISTNDDALKTLHFIYSHASMLNDFAEIFASAVNILAENLRRVQSVVLMQDRYLIIDQDNRARLQSVLDGILDNSPCGPCGDPVCAEAIVLYTVAKDILIPTCEQQLQMAVSTIISYGVSLGRQAFAVAILMEVDAVTFIHWLHSAEVASEFVRSLLSILDKSIHDQVLARKPASPTEFQRLVSRMLDRVAFFFIGSVTTTDKSALPKLLDRAFALLELMLRSAKGHMNLILATGLLDNEPALSSFEFIVENSFLSNLLPLILFNVCNILEELQDEADTYHGFYTHLNNILCDIGSTFSLPLASIKFLSDFVFSLKLLVLKRYMKSRTISSELVPSGLLSLGQQPKLGSSPGKPMGFSSSATPFNAVNSSNSVGEGVKAFGAINKPTSSAIFGSGITRSPGNIFGPASDIVSGGVFGMMGQPQAQQQTTAGTSWLGGSGFVSEFQSQQSVGTGNPLFSPQFEDYKKRNEGRPSSVPSPIRTTPGAAPIMAKQQLRDYWLCSPLFSHGLREPDNSLNSSELNLMLKFVDAPESQEVKKAVAILRKHVRSDRLGSDPRINYAVHASCAAMVWHHGMATEVLALVEDRRSEPSTQLVRVWELSQRMRTHLDSCAVRKSIGQSSWEDDSSATDLLLSPEVKDSEVPVAAIDSVIARSRALLKLTSATIVVPPTDTHEKKLWQNAAVVARMKLLPNANKELASVAKTVTAEQQLHNAVSIKRNILQRAKDEKSITLADSILQFLQAARLDIEELFDECDSRNSFASFRTSIFKMAIEMWKQEVSIDRKIRILMATAEACKSNVMGVDVHFLAGLTGASKAKIARVESAWKAFSNLIIASSLGWVDECDENCEEASDTYRALVQGLRVLVQDFRPSDLQAIKEIGLIHFLSKLTSCSRLSLRKFALKCAVFVFYRCCNTDIKATGSFLLERTTQAEIEDASRTLLPALIEVVLAHIQRAASSIEKVEESASALAISKRVLQKCVVIDPSEPGFIISPFLVPTTHSFSFWLWRPTEDVLDGTIFVKTGIPVDKQAALEPSMINRASVAMTRGADGKMYCGRQSGVFSSCGPNFGPQCADCIGILSSKPSCNNGHIMTLLLNLPAENRCDLCGNSLKNVSFLYRCSVCNFNLCPSCSEATVASIVAHHRSPPVTVAAWKSLVVKLVAGFVTLEVWIEKCDTFSVSSSVPIPVAKWTHFIYTLDAEKKLVQFYLDGLLVKEVTLIDVLAVELENISNHPCYIGQAPPFASAGKAANCAVTNAAFIFHEVDAEDATRIMAASIPSSCVTPMGVSSTIYCSNAEVVGMIGMLSRIAKSLHSGKGNSIDRLLNHDVLTPLLLLMFNGYSETIRACATKASCLLIPFSSPT